MREDAAEQYLAYKLIDTNQDWKSKWFYITTTTRSCRSPAGSNQSTSPGGTPSRRCRRVSSYPSC
jgi:hypothetical protein